MSQAVMSTVEENRVKRSAARRTLLALAASALAALPLKALLSDSGWLFEAWLTMAIVILPAALLRTRRAPSALDVWPGIILLVPWLTRVFVPKDAWGRFIPNGKTFDHISTLMNSLHHTTSDEVAPIHSTVAVRLVICALLGLLAALIDLIAVVGRRGALAGVPLLVVYTVAGAVPRTPVAWFWFAVAAAGFLILLALDAEDELREWGRRIPRRGGATSRPMLAFSAQRIGVIAVLVAVLVPAVIPAHPHNLIADAFHNDNGKGLGGFGAGSTGGSISPFAALKGQLNRTKSVKLMTVHIDGNGPVQPFYVRSNILDKFTGKGWTVSQHGSVEPIGQTTFGTEPPTGAPPAATYTATMTISGLTGNAPVFAVPSNVRGLAAGTTWSAQDQLLLGTTVHSGDVFVEDVAQPQPSVADLSAAPQTTSSPDMQRWLQLPSTPSYVVNLVKGMTNAQQTPYQRASAIFNYFADPANDFFYSLKTTKGDSGNDLVDFLKNKAGFCQQYAAAMGVMLRLAGVPSRVVLGYEHAAPDHDGNFTVTTFDAHAWVEAYFDGLGWIPFDPTPTQGLAGGPKTDLAWAKHAGYSTGPEINPTLHNSAAPTSRRNEIGNNASQGATATGPRGSSVNMPLIWVAVAIVVLGLAAATPAFVRAGRRRRRFAAARRGDPDPLWAELSDTAVDLGYVWSPARTPRQVSAWLATDAADTAPALQALAVAVEQRRYSPHRAGHDPDELARGLQEVTDQLRARRRGRVRFTARLFPASLGWGRRVAAVGTALRRRH